MVRDDEATRRAPLHALYGGSASDALGLTVPFYSPHDHAYAPVTEHEPADDLVLAFSASTLPRPRVQTPPPPLPPVPVVAPRSRAPRRAVELPTIPFAPRSRRAVPIDDADAAIDVARAVRTQPEPVPQWAWISGALIAAVAVGFLTAALLSLVL
ncbi:MAG: hypothetical protein KC503_32575 [Myxococcales bacterium]|nr:hypothetical protein [Myxococcales bacterium]